MSYEELLRTSSSSILDQKRKRGDLITLSSFLRSEKDRKVLSYSPCYPEVGPVGMVQIVINGKRRLSLDIKKPFFTKRMVKH